MLETVRSRVHAWRRWRRARQVQATVAEAGYSAADLRELDQLRSNVAVELAAEVAAADPAQPTIDEVLAVWPAAGGVATTGACTCSDSSAPSRRCHRLPSRMAALRRRTARCAVTEPPCYLRPCVAPSFVRPTHRRFVTYLFADPSRTCADSGRLFVDFPSKRASLMKHTGTVFSGPSPSRCVV